MDTSDAQLEHLQSTLTVPARVVDGVSVPDSYEGAAAAAEAGTDAQQAAAMMDMAHASTLPNADEHPPGCALCQRCEVLPQPISGRGTLHLNMPHTHTLGKVLAWVARGTAAHSRRDGTITLEVGDAGPGPALTAVAALLSSTEQRDTRAVFLPAGELFQTSDFFRVESLTTLVAKEASRWLVELLREDRVTAHFQPIVDADGRAVHAYECLMRGERDGKLVMPGTIFDAARRADLIFQVDMAGRKAAVVAAVAHHVATKVFINFTPNAIYDPTHCLDSTVRMVDDGGLERGSVVFEVTESERLPDLPHLERIVGYYRGQGFGVALDDVGAGYASLQVLLGLKPDYVKLDMSLVRNVDRDPQRAVVARKLIEACGELGLRTIAEGIETEAEWDWVRRHGVDFVQGYLFAKPARVPPGVASAVGHA